MDLIIQVADIGSVEEVRGYVDSIFWELDLKHNTGLKEACSTGDRADGVKRLISKTKLYVPYEVFGPGDIDWVGGQIMRKDLLLGAKLVASQAMLFKKMKAILIPFTMALLSSIAAPIVPKPALKVADKAAIYFMEIDSVFSFDYRKLVHFDFAREATQLKYSWAEKSAEFGRWRTLQFCLRSLLFVNSMNWYAILRRVGLAV